MVYLFSNTLQKYTAVTNDDGISNPSVKIIKTKNNITINDKYLFKLNYED